MGHINSLTSDLTPSIRVYHYRRLNRGLEATHTKHTGLLLVLLSCSLLVKRADVALYILSGVMRLWPQTDEVTEINEVRPLWRDVPAVKGIILRSHVREK